MRVGLIQFAVKFGDKEKNFSKVDELITGHSAEIWVLPELFNTGYLFTSQAELQTLAEAVPGGETCQFLQELARKMNTTLVAGIAERADSCYYNSAVVINSDGLVGTYRKIHLFDREKYFFAAGDRPFQVWPIGQAKIGVMICFDWIFPEASRTLAKLGADIICHPSNLVLPYCQNAMVTRCLENRVFAITANRIGTEKRGGEKLSFTGASQITAYNGEILHRCDRDNEQLVVIEIDPILARNKTITQNNNIFDDFRPEFYLI